MNKLQKLISEATININGKITKHKDAKISVFDRGFLYGDSIYEVTFSKDNCLLFFEEHIKRLYVSSELIYMQIYFSQEEIIQETIKTLKASKIKDAYIRIMLTRGETEITLDPNASTSNNLIIIVKSKPIYPEELYSKGMKLSIVSVLRNDALSTNPSAKSGNYLNNVMAMREAKEKGFDDAIMENKAGYITEGTTFNLWMVKDQVLYTPPVESGLLEGITRDKVISLCLKNSIELKISNFSKDELLDADEVFITSSTRGLMPIYQIDDKQFELERVLMNKINLLYKTLVDEHIKEKKYSY